MKQLAKSRFSLIRFAWAALLLLIPLLVSILACAIPGFEDQSARETDLARNVQATVNVQSAGTLQVQETQLAAKETDLAEQQLGGTVQAQQATMHAQETALVEQETQSTVEAEAPTEGALPGQESTATLAAAALTEWELTNFVEIPDGCKISDKLCWSGKSALLVLTSQSIYIDPSWNNPHLVFSHEYSFEASGDIRVRVGSRIDLLKVFRKGNQSWNTEYIDLSKYKGEEIIITFFIEGEGSKTGVSGGWIISKALKSSWSIEDIQLVPDYTPY